VSNFSYASATFAQQSKPCTPTNRPLKTEVAIPAHSHRRFDPPRPGVAKTARR
jgi:hypothetical protein